VIDFSRCGLLRRLCGILLYFSFRLKEDGAIFGAMVGFTTMEHVVRRFEYVRASAVTSTLICCIASLAALHEYLVRGPRISFLRRCSKVLFKVF
jgi:hypothetical protein